MTNMNEEIILKSLNNHYLTKTLALETKDLLD